MNRKRYLFSLIILFAMITMSAQAPEQGEETVTPYYGPSLLKDLYNPYSGFMNQGATSNYKKTDNGTFGVNYEYMVNDVIGFGADVFYHRSETSWSQTANNYNPMTGMSSNPTYSYRIVSPTFGVLGRMNIHYSSYSMFSEDFDSYVILGFGYQKTSYKVTTSDPDYTLKVTRPFFTIGSSLTPIGAKFGTGFRYFPDDNFALTIELVLGQPFVAGGLTFKF